MGVYYPDFHYKHSSGDWGTWEVYAGKTWVGDVYPSSDNRRHQRRWYIRNGVPGEDYPSREEAAASAYDLYRHYNPGAARRKSRARRDRFGRFA
jgi:hypothetical protein